MNLAAALSGFVCKVVHNELKSDTELSVSIVPRRDVTLQQRNATHVYWPTPIVGRWCVRHCTPSNIPLVNH